MQNEIISSQDLTQNLQDLNGIITSESVHPIFQNHYVNVDNGSNGLADLICEILKENGSQFNAGSESTAMRATIIAGSMFSADIIQAVQEKFSSGSTRYPAESIRVLLSTPKFMQNRIVKIKQYGKNGEDKNRPAGNCKPRAKWYLKNS